MTKAKVTDFLVEVLMKVVLFAAVLVLLPVALDNYCAGDNRAISATMWPKHQNSKGPAGLITLMWLDGWAGVAYPDQPGTTAR